MIQRSCSLIVQLGNSTKKGKIMIAIILLTTFVIIFITVNNVLKANPSLCSFGALPLSICITVLCIIGLYHNFTGISRVILIPYTALAITILAVLILGALFRLTSRSNQQPPDIPHDDRTNDNITPDSDKNNRMR